MRSIVVLTICSMAVNAIDPANVAEPPPARKRPGLLRTAAVLGIPFLVGAGIAAMPQDQNSNYISAALENAQTGAVDLIKTAIRTIEGPTRDDDVYNYCDGYLHCYDFNSVDCNSWSLDSLKAKLQEDITLAGGKDEQQLLDRVYALRRPEAITGVYYRMLEDTNRHRRRAAVRFGNSIMRFEFAVVRHQNELEDCEQLLNAFSNWEQTCHDHDYATLAYADM